MKIDLREFLQSNYIKDVDEEYDRWEEFEIIDSDKAFEVYQRDMGDHVFYMDGADKVTIVNKVYCDIIEGRNETYLKERMASTLVSLKNVALAVKLEGSPPDGGKLLIQNRMTIHIVEDNDFAGNHKILWRGAIEKVEPNTILIPLDSNDGNRHVQEDCMTRKAKEIEAMVEKSNKEWIENNQEWIKNNPESSKRLLS